MAGSDAHFYRPVDGTGLPHDPFNAIVGPRPIGWVSTHDTDGIRNLAPYSFFTAMNYRPPIIGFSSIGWKDSVANIHATGVFVWNLATRPLAAQMNETAATIPADQDEFERSGLTPVPSTEISAPRVLESPVNFECRLSQLIQLTGADGEPVQTWLVLGQVVAVHIDRRCLIDGVYDTAGTRPILRAGGPANYIDVGPEAVFAMTRPA
ncbi:flavin reductase family protein [Mycolicibacterium bacteremicum]|uniref:Asp/Glu/hydantoin racemase n=1 Tax=Mycolicibacterium bacteremicum TaxID=564198 RepID=A0A1W9YZ54_MYCBA|nr:flavin reductase family protein [Mycolicibacterium bacteremicum]MCV7435087.1 flavin reductase family protein [Mycolicibacterium bacteremicum]ORA05325.1 Asp/Glu/hydantoin racemase [Mycolicibacterium bacteremicum]